MLILFVEGGGQLSSLGHLQISKQGTGGACSFSLQLGSLADINTFSLESINFYLLHLSLMCMLGLETLNRPSLPFDYNLERVIDDLSYSPSLSEILPSLGKCLFRPMLSLSLIEVLMCF